MFAEPAALGVARAFKEALLRGTHMYTPKCA